MQYISHYKSPLGEILLAADERGLTGLWFDGQKYFAHSLSKEFEEKETTVLCQAENWLDIYFSGEKADFMPSLHMIGTDFQKEVWAILQDIPYGETTTYGDIAKTIAERRGVKKMSAQAVGNAVAHNEISIIIPCHRVVGTNGSLTGYAGGIQKKHSLLELEHVNMDNMYIPNKGTAL